MTYLRLLAGSFYNPAAYEAMRTQRQGWGLVYALFVVGITTLVGLLWLVAYFHSAVMVERNGQPPLLDQMIAQIAQQWPDMVIENDQIRLLQPQAKPITIYVWGEIFDEPFNSAFITIDTTGRTTHATMKTPVLITRDEVINKDSKGKKELRSVGEFVKDQKQPLRIDGSNIMALAKEMRGFLSTMLWVLYAVLVPITWGILTGVFFIGRAVLLLGLGGLALLLGNVGTGKMRYMEAVRLSSLAYTPVAMLSAIGFAAALRTPSTLVLLALGTLMVFVALYVTREEPLA